MNVHILFQSPLYGAQPIRVWGEGPSTRKRHRPRNQYSKSSEGVRTALHCVLLYQSIEHKILRKVALGSPFWGCSVREIRFRARVKTGSEWLIRCAPMSRYVSMKEPRSGMARSLRSTFGCTTTASRRTVKPGRQISTYTAPQKKRRPDSESASKTASRGMDITSELEGR